MKYYDPMLDQISTQGGIPLQEKYSWLPLESNSSFSSGYQVAWDSTSIAALRRCPRYYQLSIREGYRESSTPPALAFGIAIHTVLETYHKLSASGFTHSEALLRSARLAGLLGEYLPSFDTARTKETLIRTVVWYLDRFEDDPAQTIILADGSPAVEYSFSFPFDTIEGQEIYLCGHFDRIVSFLDDLYICDIKTTKHALDDKFALGFKMSPQIRTYTLAAHVLAEQVSAIPKRPAGALIDGIQLGVNYSRFQRFPINFTSAEIEDFLSGLALTIREARLYEDHKVYPTRETGCFAYGGTCPFLSVCSKPPAIRQRELDASFIRQTWNPIERRE